MNQPDAVGAPINAGDFAEQINHIRNSSPRLYGNQSNVYNAVQEWLRAGGDTRNMRQFGIDARQMEGADNYGERAVYRLLHAGNSGAPYPPWRVPVSYLPYAAKTWSSAVSCGDLRGGIEDKYILAYSNSLMDNFIMDVQGSGYIDFGDGSPLNFSAMQGKTVMPIAALVRC